MIMFAQMQCQKAEKKYSTSWRVKRWPPTRKKEGKTTIVTAMAKIIVKVIVVKVITAKEIMAEETVARKTIQTWTINKIT